LISFDHNTRYWWLRR